MLPAPLTSNFITYNMRLKAIKGDFTGLENIHRIFSTYENRIRIIAPNEKQMSAFVWLLYLILKNSSLIFNVKPTRRRRLPFNVRLRGRSLMLRKTW